MSSEKVKVGFLGAGKMATALAKGLLSSGFATSEDVIASDVNAAAREHFFLVTKAQTTASSREVLEQSQVIFLAVKPQSISSLLDEVMADLSPRHLIVSIAAGVRLSTIESAVGDKRVIRVMPNTPCLVGEGASGFSRGSHATWDDADLVSKMFSTVGLAIEVPEPLLDAVTGLSGSGPAYAFAMIEALSDGGVLMGLPRASATQLAAQTLLGAAKMVLETGEHPGQLKDAVTSPAGTTIAGLLALEQAGLRGSLMNAVRAATERARELSRS
ncbi:pyrroline-5-carboxylate reductase [Planctomicrobium piriforme]|uniref:Pyrroline-5-carboxylate reductase n=1 Tax=Planctomicrobium piriforme TaxID=1576369 RepID=A0A1I3MNV4_9PLAN|nr:pyrroline-5-carboxylate reductase [Planctomicrobium piriforme]SFI98677.1 pyrroline-5-carboxylate reductase [Planctomicrobium piriforme]